MKKMNKKGAFGLDQLPGVAITFLLVGLFFALTLVVLVSLQSTDTIQGNSAANATLTSTIDAVSEVPDNWLGIIAIVVAIAIVVGIVLIAFPNQVSR